MAEVNAKMSASGTVLKPQVRPWSVAKYDVCVCGHLRADHRGVGREFPGACSICEDIGRCSQFKLPLRR
jgi:hypothetical protein